MNTNPTKPLNPEIGVVALVPDLWGPCWQTRHFVLSRLAGYFNLVWMNPPHRWTEFVSSWRGQNQTPSLAIPPGMQVYNPAPWLPEFGRWAWLAHLTSEQRLKHASELLAPRAGKKLVLYIWRPELGNALDCVKPDLSVYHIDDEYSFSPVQLGISRSERRLLESVDQVFIHSPALMARKGQINLHTAFVSNGVDYGMYATPTGEPDDLRGIPHPRVGYVGHLKQMLDWPLLMELSAQHAHWNFVFVGPTSPHPAIASALQEMSRRENVFFLGAKPTNQLGAYPQHFDVCIMPYRVDGYTEYIYPLKMHEYLASGQPVVSAPIRSVMEFKHVIATASSADEWSDAIRQALSDAENSTSQRAERQAIAREHDWNRLVFRIARIIAERLGINIETSV
jgi:glycosyltransferase involved in cell wall biosynthesis